MERLDLKKIRTDGGTQMRVEISTDVMLDYRDKWRASVEFAPVDVFYDGATYWLADGFHRFYGAREAKKKDIPANIHNGSIRDAKLFACSANQGHGLRRTNEDKRVAVETLLNDGEWSSWSDRKIAELAGVSQPFVSKVREELITVISSPAARAANQPRTGRDGKKRKPLPTPPRSNGATKNATVATPATRDEDRDLEPTPFDHLKFWWGKADATGRCLFRNWIDGKL